MKIKIKKLHPDAKIPTYATDGSAGADLYALHAVELWPGDRVLVKTGLAAEIPSGFEGQIRPRSGLARIGITVLNAPGTIDSDYRGEIMVWLVNHGTGLAECGPGDRIAQLVIAPVVRAEFEEVEELDETARGSGGFGSTGV